MTRLRARARVRAVPHAGCRARPPRARARGRGGGQRPRPRHGAGPPLPGPSPRRLDPAVGDRRPHLDAAGRAQRREPAAAQPGRAGRVGRDARPAQRRPGRAGPRRGRASGTPIVAAGGVRLHPGRGGRRARGGHRRHPRRCGRASGSVRVDGEHHRAVGAALRAGAGAPGRDLGRRLQARGCCASPAASPTAGCPSAGYADPDALGRDERRASTRRRWPPGARRRRSGGSTTSSGSFGLGRRLPAGPAGRLGRAARRADPRPGHDHVHPRHRRRRRRAPLRRGGRTAVRDLVATERERRAADAVGCRRRHPRRPRPSASRRVAARVRSAAAESACSAARRHADTRRRDAAHRHPAVGRGEPADLPGAARARGRRRATGRPSWPCRSTSSTCTTTCAPS